ncbi:ataxin-3 homolog isoform X2 [Malus sylvestris]|uniref:ataxin-3 homolog isoform X2 n=1 Tax=Malus sylvestris TaxID=3752 RepID=UPI0021AC6539|nr:ataxin-3 homolog isoform X2 [Malus sylvestris]
MEGASNGGMLYHEVQESKLCAVHCVNTVLQGPFFSEFDLAALASDLDRKERQMMLVEGGFHAGDFLSEESHNVSLDGDFSIQDHWFCIRKVSREWYNFDSLYAAPLHLSKFYLSAYLDTLKGSGWSIFLVRGNFPKECPISSSEASNGYGQWLSPEDAERITKSCNSTNAEAQGTDSNPQSSAQVLSNEEADLLSEMEDEDLKAAIAASLLDSTPSIARAQARNPQISSRNPQDSIDNPQNNTRNLQDITDNPQNSIGNPQDSNDNPQNNTRNLKDITDNPQNSIGNPQDSNDNPQNNTDLQDSTDNPQNSIGNPQNISGNPQISTGNPQNESAGSQEKID